MSMSVEHWDHNWEKDLKPDIHLQIINLIKKYAPGKRVLEVGFGTCGDLLALSKQGFKCFGIEASEVAYENAQKKYSKKVKTVLGDAEKMPWSKNSFDVIFHQGVLEHFKNPQQFLKEQYRVLSPKGIVLIDVPHKWNVYTIYKNLLNFRGKWYGGWERSYSDRELRELARQCGFEPVTTYYRDIFPHRWGKFLFPEKIVRRKWASSLVARPPVNWVQKIARKIYDKSKFVQVVSGHNIILIVKKK